MYCGKENLFARRVLGKLFRSAFYWGNFRRLVTAIGLRRGWRICKICLRIEKSNQSYQTHQRVVGAEKLDFLGDAKEAVGGRVRQAGGDGQLDLGVVLVELVKRDHY